MKLVVGLGNPGKDYVNTRHNIGFMVLDNINNNENWKEKYEALYLEKRINNEKVIFIKPLTFMNLSGNSVIKFINYYDIELEDILVIQDDKDMDFGTFKLKRNSSSGGHNGINSIIQSLRSNEFLRLKIGVKTKYDIDTINLVLGKFSKDEMKVIEDSYSLYDKLINSFICDGITKTMNVYNTKGEE